MRQPSPRSASNLGVQPRGAAAFAIPAAWAGVVMLGAAGALMLGAGGDSSSVVPAAVGHAGFLAAHGGLDGSTPRLDPTLLYNGNASCAGSGCHSADKPKTLASGKDVGDELNIWEKSDPHAKAFKSLRNDTSKKIAAALKLGDATTADRCISCHAMPVAAAQRGPKFKDVSENAVGCESCHGASQKYLEPHVKEGWTDAQRKTGGAAGLQKDWGLIDTTDLGVRAKMCVTCHLHIDKDLIDAGHPALKFEMYSYNNYNFKENYAIHWDDGRESLRRARLWAIGQVVALEAAKAQQAAWQAKGWDTAGAAALTAVFEAGAGVVKKAFQSDQIKDLDGSAVQATTVKAALAGLVAAADAFKATPGDAGKQQRAVLASGVEALVSATVADPEKDLSDDFFDAQGVAAKGEPGDAWLAALRKMAAAAK